MKNYQLLTNSTYLYLLQHQGIKINFSSISKAVGLSRQTVAKEYKEFCDLEGWTDNVFGIKEFYNEETNKNIRAVKILKDIRPDIQGVETIANVLGVSSKTLYNLKFIDDLPTPASASCVYKITYKDEIIYIGSTSNFEIRKFQHLAAIEEKSIKSKLYKYCLDNNIKANQLKIEPLISEDEFSRFNIEQTIIKLLKPVGNCE